MRIEPLAPAMTFAEFCNEHGFELVAKERSIVTAPDLSRWYVTAEPHIEIMGSGILTSVSGNGDTPEEARLDFAERIKGCRLVMSGWRDERREFYAPNEWEKTDGT